MKYTLLFVLIFISSLLLGGKYVTVQNRPPRDFFLASYDRGSPTDPERIIIERYLKRYNSPLYPYASEIVLFSHKFSIDPKLIVAISGIESSYGRFGPYYNSFGIGGSSAFKHFESYQDSIYFVAELLGTSGYYKAYRETKNLEILANVYCGPACKGWASTVRKTMEKI